MNKPSIVILGGGVAGMSAAQELAERGFKVSVYEKQSLAGGKSRSVQTPLPFAKGKQPLPGEHGFRFFPRFYKHVTDTMKRIPVRDASGKVTKSVFDNLVETTTILMPQYGRPAIETQAKAPATLAEFVTDIQRLERDFVLTDPENAERFAWHVMRYAMSCAERRMELYESEAWWGFIDAQAQNIEYQKLFAQGITRSLVAAKAKEASTRTMGAIFLQLQFDTLRSGGSSDRILNAPTYDAWTSHWSAHLAELGVDYHFDTPVKEILYDDERVVGAVVVDKDGERTVTGDHYVLCVPVERAAPLLNEKNSQGKAAVDLAPELRNLDQLKEYVEWMNGLQIYLKRDVPLNHGHAIYVDTEWALTSVSQHRFWKDTDLSNYGDGTVKGILSIDISDWKTPGILDFKTDLVVDGQRVVVKGDTVVVDGQEFAIQAKRRDADGEKVVILQKKKACECTEQEIMAEVWAQLQKSLNIGGANVLTDDHLHSMYLDKDIQFEDGKVSDNLEPLLVNYKDTWKLRPRADTAIPNLFLAADYVQTTTDLATMEGANEAARRAVNAIIEASGAKDVKPCELFKMLEPRWLSPFKWLDLVMFRMGMGHLLATEGFMDSALKKRVIRTAVAVFSVEAKVVRAARALKGALPGKPKPKPAPTHAVVRLESKPDAGAPLSEDAEARSKEKV